MNFNHPHSHTGNSSNLSSGHNPNSSLGKQRAYQSQLHQQQQLQQQQQQFPQQLSPPFHPQQQQLPLKTYLLNKYGQYQNSPTSQLIEQDGSPIESPTSSSVLQAVIAGSANNILDSVLKAPSGHNSSIFNSISSHLNNESGFLGAGSNSLLKHQHQSNYISKFASPQTAVAIQQQHQQHHQSLFQTSNPPANNSASANASLSSQLINLLDLQSSTNSQAALSAKNSGAKRNAKRTPSKKNAEKLESLIKESPDHVVASSSKNPTSNLLQESHIVDSNLEEMATSAKRKYSGSNSSLQNSDEDDDLDESFSGSLGGSKSKEEKRRLSHTAAEQKRRNAIKLGYERLQKVVPSCQQPDPILSVRITRATTLDQTIDYIYELEKDKEKHEEEMESLKKEIMALRIMKTNYEEMVQYHRNMPKDENVEVNDETKFELFTKFADNLFHSFQTMVSTNSFSEMSSSILNWIEHSCSANNLRNLVFLSLVQIGQQILQ